MRFSSVLMAGAALVASVLAKVEFTNDVFGTLMAGQPFTLTWADATGPVTITLRTGASNNLQTVATVATGLSGTSFVWTPSTSIPSGSYALEITDGATSNYSPLFVLGGGSVSVPATVSASGSAATVTATGSSSLPGLSTASASASTASSASTHATTLSTKSSSASASASSSGASSSASAATQTTSSTPSSTSSTPTSTTQPPDSAAAGLSSPLAFVLLAVAALITLN